MPLSLPRPVLAHALATMAVSVAATAQCTMQWSSTGGVPGPDNIVRASVTWDPDGSGPLAPRLVLAGAFTVAGDALASRIVAYDPTARSWSALGAGFDSWVDALAVLPNGGLVAAGVFTSAGGVGVSRIARWDGIAWQPLGAGCDGEVMALTVLPSGDLVAGGLFATAGGVGANCIARWNGTTWAALAGGIGGWSNSYVAALQVDGNGDLIAAGRFATAGGVAAKNIARWNGATWTSLAAGIGSTSDLVLALTRLPNGNIIAGGSFATASGVSAANVAAWDGTVWSPLAAGPGGSVAAFAVLPNGELLAGGGFHVRRWNGATWSSVGSASGVVYTVAPLANGDVVVGGSFLVGAGLVPDYALRFNGAVWERLDRGLDNEASALAVLPNGDVIAGGAFTASSGLGTNRVARWSGGIWAPLSSGMDGVVNVLAVMPSGDLVAGGSFTTAGGVSANRVARWDGVAWSPLGSGVDGVVNALLPMPNGDLIAAGAFTNAGGSPALRIARWNGATWSTLGAGLSGSFPFVAAQALCRLANGDIVAGGSFNVAGGVPANGIARWNGSSWSPLGAGANPVLTLAALPNGHLVAGGAFNQAGGGAANCVARWDGSSWAQLGAGTGNSVTALLRLPNGDLIATGLFDTPARRIARWDGVSWSSFGAGLGSVASGVGLALAQTPNGEVHVAGNFLSAGNLASAYVARLSTTCPATVVAFGAGCVGSGGANVITASSLPWLGAPFAVAATGMPALGLVVEVRGLAAATVPLVSILPQAAVGCSLLATPDWLDVHVPVAGNVATTILAPNTIGLIGQSMVQQFVALELNAWVRSSVSPAPTR